MIRVSTNLWICGSTAHNSLDKLNSLGITALLNVACDLEGYIGWDSKVEYAQVGLIDGPGNPPAAYNAAILTLNALAERHDRIVVYCHGGGRALAVCLMYLSLKGGQRRPEVTGWSYWPTWDELIKEIHEYTCCLLPVPHEAHIEAYSKIPFGLLGALL